MRHELWSGFYSVNSCMEHQSAIFIFGDNMIRKGKKGQSIIRDCSNSHGIPTKRLPSLQDNAFFSDRQSEYDALIASLNQLEQRCKDPNITVCYWPSNGLGTGLARMNMKSPRLYQLMNSEIHRRFGIKYN